MKLVKKDDGCQKFVCECKPIAECSIVDLSTPKPINDGMQEVIDNSGCCPILKLVCKKELCPKPLNCSTYFTLKKEEIPEKCCPIYKCVEPLKCIVTLTYTASEIGGERERTTQEEQKLLKEVCDTCIFTLK